MADAERRADDYRAGHHRAEVVIHAADAGAAPVATRILEGTELSQRSPHLAADDMARRLAAHAARV
ncbi:MAG: hypothetical protein OEW42_18890 [Acidimicrobiia bacterium]|nr:hypothetical protein [Acidimicrobiia bacterium]